jgi:putative hemolysin
MDNAAIPGDHLRIDVRQLIAGKNPSLAAKMPRLVIRTLEKILHVREINDILSKYRHLSGTAFIDRALEDFGAELVISGGHFLEGLERPIIVSNHPLGGLDGMALLSLVSRFYDDVKVLVNDFLMAIPNLQEVFVPVNKLGGNRQHQQRYRDLFASQAAILHFPVGLCSRRKGGRLRDLRWNRSYVRLARENRRPIVPVFFDGENRRVFYRVANLRRWFGVGFNVEMIMLVDEMFRQRGKVLEARVGAPIFPEEIDDGDLNHWNGEIRRRVYALGDS